MGFFDSLVKVAQGKPVFDAKAEQASTDANESASPYHDDKGSKIYPELVAEQVDCRVNGDRMQVYVYIRNASQFPLVLDRVRFLGSDKQMPSDLSVGENMQYLIYDGLMPRSNSTANLEITYCNEARDFFSAMYYAEFKPEANGLFSVKQFRKQRGVKDI